MARLINLPTENYSGVYTITNMRNGKVYIGSSVNIMKRAIVHEREIRKSRHSNKSMQKDIKKDDLFKFDVVEIIDENKCFDYNELNTKTRNAEYLYILNAKKEGLDLYNRESENQIKGRINGLSQELEKISKRKLELNEMLNYSNEKLLLTYKHEIFNQSEKEFIEKEILKRMN